ncbi:MAG: hypothetical protein JNN06_01345 [Gemmobacter sp.]|uniref:hypothetical protein n=1 Tax=Gemmobacter sp. TaxID=1898957 RepID=UPI001A5F10E9|nr:hypothetical protein [Gemmobacter sp.]MBL8560899.1 hypothetical protein [Gemmobacter sp.]
MATIRNPGLRDKTLPTGHVIPRQGHLTTTNDVIRCPDNAPFLNGQKISGALQIEEDPDPETFEVPAAVAAEVPSLPVTSDLPQKGKKG